MMVAQGGTEDQAKALADVFSTLIVDLELEHKAIEDENEKIKAKADIPTRRKKEAKPNEFDTYDEFCPGCTLELKVMTSERANLYSDLFVRALSSDSEGRGDPGLFVYRGWGLRRRLGAPEQQYLADLETQSKKMHKDLPDQYPFVHGMSDKTKAVNIALNIRGNPHALGPEVPRAFLTVLGTPDKKPYSEGSGRLELANDIVASPIASRVWSTASGSGTLARASSTARTTSARSAIRPRTPSFWTIWPCASARTACHSRSSNARSCSQPSISRVRRRPRRRMRRIRTIVSTLTSPCSVSMPSSSAIRFSSWPAISI